MKHLPALLIFLALCSSAQAQYTATVKTSVTKSDLAGWRKWSNGVCTIDYPSSWSSEGTGPNDLTAAFTQPADSTGRSGARVELHVKPAAGLTADKYAEQLREVATKHVKNAQFNEPLSDEDSCTLEFTGELDGSAVRVKQQARIKDGQAWILSYTAAPSRFEDGLYLAEAMFASFSVK
jgi:hypothetical protein